MDLTQPTTVLPIGTVSVSVIGTSTRFITTPTSVAASSGTPTTSTPTVAQPQVLLTPSEKKIKTHGILMSIGFLVILPLGTVELPLVLSLRS